jgi:hypothetical protein
MSWTHNKIPMEMRETTNSNLNDPQNGMFSNILTVKTLSHPVNKLAMILKASEIVSALKKIHAKQTSEKVVKILRQ